METVGSLDVLVTYLPTRIQNLVQNLKRIYNYLDLEMQRFGGGSGEICCFEWLKWLRQLKVSRFWLACG